MIGAIVQTRMSSQRLAGKVLRQTAGKPLIQYLLERLKCCRRLEAVIVATSTHESDAPIADFCRHYGITCFRGSLLDVAGRFNAVLNEYSFEAFARVNGDSPLLDPALVDRGVDCLLNSEAEIVTNVLPRTYPRGQSVEVLRTQTFRRGYEQMHQADDLEHVTSFFYRNQQGFRIHNFESTQRYGRIQLAVDTEHDLRVFAAIVARMDRPHWEYGLTEIVRLYHESCKVSREVSA